MSGVRRRSERLERPAVGTSLPCSSRMQATTGPAVSRADLQPGDLVHRNPVSHVSLYTGNGQRGHASAPAQPVDVVGVDSVGGIVARRRA